MPGERNCRACRLLYTPAMERKIDVNQTPEPTSDRYGRSFALGWMVVGFTATAQFFAVGIAYYTFGGLPEAADRGAR